MKENNLLSGYPEACPLHPTNNYDINITSHNESVINSHRKYTFECTTLKPEIDLPLLRDSVVYSISQ
jgi:hypothetical protein